MRTCQKASKTVVDTALYRDKNRMWSLKSIFLKRSALSIEKVPFVVIILLTIDIGLSSAYLINYMIGQPFHKFTVLLNLNSEKSIANWYSTIKFFSISVLAGLFAYRYVSWEKRGSLAIVVLPILFIFLSMDEAVSIHEWLGRKSDILLSSSNRAETFFHHTGIWMFTIGIPFLIFYLLFLFFIREYFTIKTGSLKKVVFGMIILLIGALGFETLSNFPQSYDSLGYLLIVCCEETFEMAGSTIIFWGFYDLAIDLITIKES